MLLISTRCADLATLPLFLFQSRNRDAFDFNMPAKHTHKRASAMFQSRNRDAFDFNRRQTLIPIDRYPKFQSRNRDAFDFN